MMQARLGLAFLSMVAFSACTETDGPERSSIPDRAFTVVEAVGLFKQVCLDNLPELSRAAETLNRLGASKRSINGVTIYTIPRVPASFGVDEFASSTLCTMQYAEKDGRRIDQELKRISTQVSKGTFVYQGNSAFPIETLTLISEDNPGRPIYSATVGVSKGS